MLAANLLIHYCIVFIICISISSSLTSIYLHVIPGKLEKMESVRGGPLDSPDNHQSVVKVVTWMLCATATLCVVVRFWTKLALTRLWTLDDTLISIAWV